MIFLFILAIVLVYALKATSYSPSIVIMSLVLLFSSGFLQDR